VRKRGGRKKCFRAWQGLRTALWGYIASNWLGFGEKKGCRALSEYVNFVYTGLDSSLNFRGARDSGQGSLFSVPCRVGFFFFFFFFFAADQVFFSFLLPLQMAQDGAQGISAMNDGVPNSSIDPHALCAPPSAEPPSAGGGGGGGVHFLPQRGEQARQEIASLSATVLGALAKQPALGLSSTGMSALNADVLEHMRSQHRGASAVEFVHSADNCPRHLFTHGGPRTGGGSGTSFTLGTGRNLHAIPGATLEQQARASLGALGFLFRAAPQSLKDECRSGVVSSSTSAAFFQAVADNFNVGRDGLKSFLASSSGVGIVADPFTAAEKRCADYAAGHAGGSGESQSYYQTFALAAHGVLHGVDYADLVGAGQFGRDGSGPRASESPDDSEAEEEEWSGGQRARKSGFLPRALRREGQLGISAAGMQNTAALLLGSRATVNIGGVCAAVEGVYPLPQKLAQFGGSEADRPAGEMYSLPLCGVEGCPRPAVVLCACQTAGTYSSKSRLCKEHDLERHTYQNPACSSRLSWSPSTRHLFTVAPNLFFPSSHLVAPEQLLFRSVPLPQDSPGLCTRCSKSGDFSPTSWVIEPRTQLVPVYSSRGPKFLGGRVLEWTCTCGFKRRTQNADVYACGAESLAASLTKNAGGLHVGTLRARAAYDGQSLHTAMLYHTYAAPGIPASAVANVFFHGGQFSGQQSHAAPRNVFLTEQDMLMFRGAFFPLACVNCPVKGGESALKYGASDGNHQAVNYKARNGEVSEKVADGVCVGSCMLAESIVTMAYEFWKGLGTVVKDADGAVLYSWETGDMCIGGGGVGPAVFAAAREGKKVAILNYSGLYTLVCDHEIPYLAFPLLTAGEGMLPLLISLLLGLGMGLEHFQCDILCMFLRMLRARDTANELWASELLHILFPELRALGVGVRFKVGDYNTEQKGHSLKVEFLAPVGEEVRIPPLQQIPRGHLPAIALQTLLNVLGERVEVDVAGKKYFVVGSHVLTVSLSILHAFAHKCMYALSAAFVPGALCAETVEWLNCFITPRTRTAGVLSTSNWYSHFACMFEQRRSFIRGPDAPRDSLVRLLNALLNLRRRKEDLREEFGKCKGMAIPSQRALFADPIEEDGTLSPPLSQALDQLYAEKAAYSQGGRGGWVADITPPCEDLKRMQKAALLLDELHLLRMHVLAFSEEAAKETGAGILASGGRGGTRAFVASQQDHMSALEKFHSTVATAGAAITSKTKKAALGCESLEDAQTLVEKLEKAHASAVGKVEHLPPETRCRQAVASIFSDYYERLYFKKRLGVGLRGSLSDLEKQMYQKRIATLSKQINTCVDVFNLAWPKVPLGVKTAAGGKWALMESSTWEVPPLRAWGEDKRPEGMFPIGLQPGELLQPMCDLLYRRDMAVRAQEGVTRACQSISCVRSGLQYTIEAFKRMGDCIESASIDPRADQLFLAIPRVLRQAGRGEPVDFTLPNPAFKTWLRSCLYEQLEKLEKLVEYAERAELAANCWASPAAPILSPCKHKVAKLRFRLNGLLRGHDTPQALRDASCKCKCVSQDGVEDFSEGEEVEEEDEEIFVCEDDE